MPLGAGRKLDLDILCEVTANMGMMPGMSICGLPDGAVFPIRTLVQKFRKELETRIAAQSPDAAARYIKQINPAAYVLPIYQGRATVNDRGTMSSEHYAGTQR